MTFKSLVLRNINDPQSEWCRIMYECADALYYNHSKEYLHNYLKGVNVIINENSHSLHPVIIDLGKCSTIAGGKIYHLSPRDQEKYTKYHKHVAPEVVR